MIEVHLYDLQMNDIYLRGVQWLEFTPDPPSSDRDVDSVYHGEVPLGKRRKPRLIKARFLYTSTQFLDYKILRDELHSLLSPLKEMYAVDSEVPGKRWKVEVESYKQERINGINAEVEIVFYCAKGLAESYGTTLEDYPHKDFMWKYVIGDTGELPWEYELISPEIFTIFNGGNVEVDPRSDELIIEIEARSDGGAYLSLENQTTGDTWEYDQLYSSSTTFLLDGTNTTKNGVNATGDTNLNVITLAPGINNFSLTGANGYYVVKFGFRYLYE